MKKYICILLCVSFCCITACTPSNHTIDSQSEYGIVIDSGKYYQIYKSNDAYVYYTVYDINGKIVLSEKTDKPISINMLDDNIVDIAIGMGTGITLHKYYGIKQDVFSQDFIYVLSNQNELVAFIDIPEENPFENRKVIVQNVFGKDRFYKEFQLDFAHIDTPVVDATFSKDGTSLHLTYLSGEEQTLISTTLSLIQQGG